MKIYLTCDGACEPNPGQMAIGAVATKPAGERGEKREKVLELSEKLGGGTNNQAEYHAVLKGLKAMQKLYMEQKLPTLREIKVFTDSQLVQRQLSGEYAINDAVLGSLADQVGGIESYFRKQHVLVDVIWQESDKTRAAHNLAMKALLGEAKFKDYMIKHDLITRVEQGEILIPLDVLRMKKYKKLTVSECIVVYLLDTCGKSLFQAAEWMGRSKSTIRTQYSRAKKKLPADTNTTAMPVNYQKRERMNIHLRMLRQDRIAGETEPAPTPS